MKKLILVFLCFTIIFPFVSTPAYSYELDNSSTPGIYLNLFKMDFPVQRDLVLSSLNLNIETSNENNSEENILGIMNRQIWSGMGSGIISFVPILISSLIFLPVLGFIFQNLKITGVDTWESIFSLVLLGYMLGSSIGVFRVKREIEYKDSYQATLYGAILGGIFSISISKIINGYYQTPLFILTPLIMVPLSSSIAYNLSLKRLNYDSDDLAD